MTISLFRIAAVAALFAAPVVSPAAPAASASFDGTWQACQRYDGELWCQSLQLEQRGAQIRGAWNWRASNTGGTNLFKGRVVDGRVEFDPEGCSIGANGCEPRTPSKQPSYLLQCGAELQWGDARMTACNAKIDDGSRYRRVARDQVDTVDFSAQAYFDDGKAHPSFDCAKAKTPVERGICADPAAARTDSAIAHLYAKLLPRFSGDAVKGLREDQRWFVGVRDAAYEQAERGERAKVLREQLDSRLKDLQRIREFPRKGLVGDWNNFAGGLEISRDAQGVYRVRGNAAHPIDGRWVCDADLSGSGNDERVLARAEGDADGTGLQLTRIGNALRVQELDVRGQPHPASEFCGHNGSFDGWYFQSMPRQR
ncbi:lysozyme inhibitor LprI family protein [Lysobacter enzymogenes]|uniref:lysozyme inhibitor LprI family protein n=1 Tax=Lysobacter enzymogenes TaxID=69 RepID=UPI00099C0BB4|nr:hypothetical protein [Lysobacter enzymogenes]UZW60689.1 hypothetical protein BV903_026160 [Lysobacter enzymogenes]